MLLHRYGSVRIFFHMPQQLQEVGNMGYRLNENETLEVQFNYEDTEMIAKIDEKGNITCSLREYDICHYERRIEFMMEHSNCTAPWITGLLSMDWFWIGEYS